MINKVFSPAVSLMNKLTYPKKIALLGGIGLLTIAILSLSLFLQLNKTIKESEIQLEGIEDIIALNKVIQLAQQYRGLSAATFGGDTLLSKEHEVKEQETEDALYLALSSLNSNMVLKTGETDVSNLDVLWLKIKSDHGSTSAEVDFAIHSLLVSQLQLLIKLVAEHHMLISDSELTSYYLIDNLVNNIPESIEYMGQIRAIVTGVLTYKQLSEIQKEQLIRLDVLVKRAFDQFEFNISAIKRHTPEIAGVISQSYNVFLANKNTQLKLVKEDVLTQRFSSSPVQFYNNITEEINRVYDLMNHELTPRLQMHITKRIEKAKITLFKVIGLAVFLLLVILYLMIGLYQSVLNNVRHISQAINDYSQGNLETRIKLDTFDEMREISISVNDMADRINKSRVELEQEKERFKFLFDKSGNGLAIIENGVLIDCNEQSLKMMGYDIKQELLKSPAILSPEYQADGRLSSEKAQEMIAICHDFGKHGFEWLHKKKDGTLFWVDVLLTKLEYQGKGQVHVVWRDLTQEKKGKEEPIQSEERLNNAQMTAHLGSWDFDLLSNQLEWSDEVYRIFEYDKDLAPNYDYFLNSIPEEDRDKVVEAYEESVEFGYDYSVEHRVIMKDGRVKYVHEQGQTTYDLEGKPTRSFGSVLDITDRKEQEFKLIELQEKADKANKAKSAFLANMSHELRTPMHGILSFSSFGMKKSESAERSKLNRYFSNINTSGERLLNLLNDLLDLSKLEAEKVELEFKEANLVSIFKQCLLEQEQRIKDLGLILDIKSASDPVIGEFDDIRIGQVITNILSNAIKFSPEGAEISVDISNNDKGELCFSLQDTGVGIPEKELDLVFDAFVQSSKTDTGAGGTGLGLAISKKIVESHNGNIWAKNNPDGGAIFTFTLPQNNNKQGAFDE